MSDVPRGDIDTIWQNPEGVGDYALDGADLQRGHDLMTQILISLFSDREARPDDVIPDGTKNRRGWCFDDADYPIGSRLWLLDRAKITNQTALRAKEYIAEALQWMIDDGVVAGFDITTRITNSSQLRATITAYRSTLTKTGKRFGWTWTGAVLYPAVPEGAPVEGPVLTDQDGNILTLPGGQDIGI